MITESIAPYSRYIRLEHDKLKDISENFLSLKNEVNVLKTKCLNMQSSKSAGTVTSNTN